MHTVLLLILFLLSGAAGLLYQVLWQRQLGLLFGNTAHAAAATLAIFFLGIALGSWWCGERAARTTRPLRAYAWLEIGIAVTALLFFALLPLYRLAYGPLFALLGGVPGAFAVAKLLLAALVLLPPAVCMGGTLPMMGQHLVRRADALGRLGTLLYAVNTLGGALGALLAGFWLPGVLGVTRAYGVAVAVSLAVAAAALALAARTPATAAADADAGGAPANPPTAALPPRLLLALAALSGFVALGLEVLWTRMFALVLHNSVYSFAAILTVFLLALAGGAALAHGLGRRAADPAATLCALLVAAGLAVALSPFAFHAATDGLAYVAAESRWYAYLRAVFGVAALAMLGPGLLVGTIFPFLLHATPLLGGSAGRTLGRLAAVNTAGAIAGALASGFVLLAWVGLWGGIKTLALLYLAAAVFLAPRVTTAPTWLRAAPLAALLLVATLLDPGRLPVTRTAPGEAVLGQWESAYGVTSVVERGGSRRIKLDNYYALGSTGALTYERTQADLPLVLHAQPRRVFFLGLGTGITAGAALEHPIESLRAAELVPDVVTAARTHFAPYLNDLFTDPRAEVVVADGRTLLLADATPHDVIVADLFIPWQPGAGSLYTREHFTAVRARLAPGGLFAQWLPLYQLSRDEFMVIARTMLEVFPQVTLWRGDFLPDRPIVALVGQTEATPLEPDQLVANFLRRQGGAAAARATILALTGIFYAGNLGANRDLFTDYVVNTDDWPVIEYSSPITQREQRGRAAQWFTDAPLGAFFDTLAARLPVQRDPYLARLSDRERGYVDAGRALFAARVARAAGRDDEAAALADVFAAAVPFEVFVKFDDTAKP